MSDAFKFEYNIKDFEPRYYSPDLYYGDYGPYYDHSGACIEPNVQFYDAVLLYPYGAISGYITKILYDEVDNYIPINYDDTLNMPVLKLKKGLNRI